jgi:6-phosphogluconolactonase
MRFWLGGYGAGVGGSASGIGALVAGAPDDALAGGQLSFGGAAARFDGSPSWLAAHPAQDVVYAAIEDLGVVRAFRRTGESSFAPLGGAVAAGEAVCHIAVAPDARSLIASCWGDGRVVRMSLDAEGRPSAPVTAQAATDPYDPDAAPAEFAGGIDLASAARALRAAAGDQYAHLVPDYDSEPASEPAETVVSIPADEGANEADSRASRAHQAVFLPGGLVATSDMGLDLVRFWRATDAGLRPLQDVVLPRGTGPRHMVRHPSGHLYVVAELSCEVYALAADVSGAWRVVTGTPLGAGTLAGDTAAELSASREGDFLYAGVRGSNTLATLRVRGSGDVLAPVALVDAGVDWPRHHLVVRDTLLVAGERSDEVASLTLDLRTGVPGRVRHRVEAPSPTCVLAAK